MLILIIWGDLLLEPMNLEKLISEDPMLDKSNDLIAALQQRVWEARASVTNNEIGYVVIWDGDRTVDVFDITGEYVTTYKSAEPMIIAEFMIGALAICEGGEAEEALDWDYNPPVRFQFGREDLVGLTYEQIAMLGPLPEYDPDASEGYLN